MAANQSTQNNPTKDMSPLSANDIVILVTGITGSGKSSFIKLLTNDNDVSVGHGLTAHTATVQPHFYETSNGQRVYLIDTPGFNDTVRSDSSVLKDIAFFLAQTYTKSIHLTGIVYLHKITDNRMGGASLRNLQIVQKLCGQSAYRHVALTTTMWDALQDSGKGDAYEEELIARDEWWGDMTRHQSHVARHDGQLATARGIIQRLIASRNPELALAIQKEMVLQKMSLENTSAGLQAVSLIRAAQERQQSELGTVQENIEVALRSQNDNAVRALRSQKSGMQSELEKTKEAQQALKIDSDALLKEGEERYQKLLLDSAREREENERAIKKYEEELQQLRASQEAGFQERRRFQAQLEETERQIRESERDRRAEDLERLNEEKTALQQRIRQLEEQNNAQEAERQGTSNNLRQRRDDEVIKRRKRDLVKPILQTLAGIGTAIVGFLGVGGPEGLFGNGNDENT